MPTPVTATARTIATAGRVIAEGRLVAFPTETVYGLGADALNEKAVAAIFAAKARPRFNPLICHVADAEVARRLVQFNDVAERLTARFWPGALTVVLPRTPDCKASLLASAGLPSLAVRLPAHPVAIALIKAAGRPIVAPSANRSGHISPTKAAHVAQGLGDSVAMILDGGPCRIGLESTVVGLTGDRPVLLRPGGIETEKIEAVTGPLARPEDGRIEAPGMMTSHYAPTRPLRLNATSARPGEVLLAFGAAGPPGHNLSQSGDLTEAAANLFAMLHALDRPPFNAIAVMPVPDVGLGRAINDRLRRAATHGASED